MDASAPIGLGTYSFTWHWSDRARSPFGLIAMLQRTAELGVDLFQICDYPPLLEMSVRQRAEVRSAANDLGIRLQLGTRGITREHLATFLGLAEIFDATLVRSMIFAPDQRPTMGEAEQSLRTSAAWFAAAGITLALETYEQIATKDLVALIESIGNDHLGICLDPANCVAALEHPRAVVERCAPYVSNIHVKDFAFARQEGWVGFALTGAQLGTGLLDWRHLRQTVEPARRSIDLIVEHWLPWQGDQHATLAAEDQWTRSALDYLKEQS